jgi:BlaI family penicillinase repressor
MAAKTPLIADAEWKVMRVLWKKAPLGAYDIIQELAERESWHPNTIKTLLARLVKKGAIKARKYKNLFLYEPAISEEECIHAESETLLERWFGGAVQPLLVHFAKRKKMSKADLEELRRILEGNGKEKKK